MKFYLGTHRPNWLAMLDVPLFVSTRRLKEYRKLPQPIGCWALDSGAFTEIATHGKFETSAAKYVGQVRRYVGEMGGMDWAAPQDWMCEPPMLVKTGLTVEEHQWRTVENYVELRELAPEVRFIPVLQGWRLADYERCVEMYDAMGVDLWGEETVGIGSVCRRQSTREIAELVGVMSGMGLRLHGFGVKTKGLEMFSDGLVSADSMAWSFNARKNAPLPGCTHRNCANCMMWALRWRAKLLRQGKR